MGLLPIFQRGDILQFKRLGYSHYGVYVGNDEVVHVFGRNSPLKLNPVFNAAYCSYRSSAGESHEFKICRTSMSDLTFVERLFGSICVSNDLDNFLNPLCIDEIVDRALAMVGEKWEYDVISNNCEHFATHCRYGERLCMQMPIFKGCWKSLWTFLFAGVELNQLYGYTGPDVLLTTTGSFTFWGLKVDGPCLRMKSGKVGHRYGYVREFQIGEIKLGPIALRTGGSVSTTTQCSDGTIGIEIFGTGFTIGRVTSIQFNGCRLSLKLW